MNDEQVLLAAAKLSRTAVPRCTLWVDCTTRCPTNGIAGSSFACTRLTLNCNLKAWTPVEVNWFEFLTKKSTKEILQDLREAGWAACQEAGQRFFHPEVRDQLCEHKANAYKWLEVHKAAHEVGLRSNSTMLYGHIENAHHRLDHLLRLRELQDETAGSRPSFRWHSTPTTPN